MKAGDFRNLCFSSTTELTLAIAVDDESSRRPAHGVAEGSKSYDIRV